MRKREMVAASFLLAATLTGCWHQEADPTTVPTETTVPTTAPVIYTTPKITTPYDYTEPEATYENGSNYEPFGSPVTFEISTEDLVVKYMIHLPDDADPIFENKGFMERYIILEDGREILYGYMKETAANSLAEIDTAITDRISSNFASGYISSEDLVIEQSSMQDINGIEMKKIQIRLTLHKGSAQEYKMKFVVYATDLNSGGYAFFLAGCKTSQSLFVLTRKTADNMAMTFSEA